MKKFLLILASPAALSGLSFGTIYTQDFNGLTSAVDLAGQDNWQISGNASNATSGVSLVTSSFLSGGGRAAALGYQDLASGESSVYLSHSYGDSLVGNSAGYTQFLGSIAIFDSIPGAPGDPSYYANRDTFGITFRSGAANLLTISFTPTLQDSAPDLSNRVDSVSWTGFGGTGSIAPFGTITEGGAGNPSILDIMFTPSGASDVLFTLKSSGVPLTSGLLIGAAGENLTSFGFTMNTFSNTSQVGTNQFVFDNLSVVPEPSSAILGLLGVSAFLGRRRRA